MRRPTDARATESSSKNSNISGASHDERRAGWKDTAQHCQRTRPASDSSGMGRPRGLSKIAESWTQGVRYGYPVCCIVHFCWDGLFGWPSTWCDVDKSTGPRAIPRCRAASFTREIRPTASGDVLRESSTSTGGCSGRRPPAGFIWTSPATAVTTGTTGRRSAVPPRISCPLFTRGEAWSETEATRSTLPAEPRDAEWPGATPR